MTLQDLMYSSLGSLAYTGSLTDRLFQFFKDGGATSNNVVNAEFEWLGILGYTQPMLQDRRVAHLYNLGYTDLSGWTAAFDNTLLYSHRNLFLNGEQGVWYDPSDLSTLFQDSAGTTPVTAAGQPVGLILDKSKGLVRGAEDVVNGTFDSGTTSWSPQDGNVVLANVGGMLRMTLNGASSYAFQVVNVTANSYHEFTADYVLDSNVTGAQIVIRNTNEAGSTLATLTGSAGKIRGIIFPTTSTVSVRLAATGITNPGVIRFDNVSVKQLPGNHASQSTAGARPILRQTPASYGPELVTNGTFAADANWTKGAGWTISGGVAAGSAASSNLTQAGVATNPVGKTYEVTIQIVSITGGSIVPQIGGSSKSLNAVGTYVFFLSPTINDPTLYIPGSNFTGTIDNVSVKEVLSYRTDRNYLEFDGIDDFLVTQSINFTSTDKMTVWAGVRKLSDAAIGMLVELSTNSDTANGSFSVRAPGDAATANYYWGARGDTAHTAFSSTTYAAPISNITSVRFDLAGALRADEILPRINGGVPALTPRASGSAGAGNFGNHPLYIGRRGGTTLPFNGRLYALVVRGAASTTAQIIAAEREIARRTGVTL